MEWEERGGGIEGMKRRGKVWGRSNINRYTCIFSLAWFDMRKFVRHITASPSSCWRSGGGRRKRRRDNYEFCSVMARFPFRSTRYCVYKISRVFLKA